LTRLAQGGLPVPGGFIVTTDAYRRFVEANDLQERIIAALDAAALGAGNEAMRPAALESAAREIRGLFSGGTLPDDVATSIRTAYDNMGSSSPVAVRSSATAEDLPDLSFAGQQDTYLNITGAAAVLEAVKRCWASLWTARAIDYRLRHVVPQESVALAVVVQTLVPAETAGILFTANPINGREDEMVINASWGLGEAIVGGQVSPDTVIVDKPTGQVKKIEVADKTVMTVTTPDGTTESKVDSRRRRERVLTDTQIAELSRLGRRIEDLYPSPQDIEWCWAEDSFYIVQSRPITTLSSALAAVSQAVPVPDIPATDTWKGPSRRAKYMRNNIVELIPDPMTPLFATLGRHTINCSMSRLMADFMGKRGLMPDELIIIIEGYAYYNGDFGTKEILQILLNSVGIAKYMFTGAEARWLKADAAYRAKVAEYEAKPWRAASAQELLEMAPDVLDLAISYYGALVAGLIPAAWISEGLFSSFYKTLVKRKSDPRPETFLLGFDSVPIRGEKALYDLAQWAAAQPALAEHLQRTDSSRIAGQVDAPKEVPPATWNAWQSRFSAYLAEFGGTIYNLDIATPTPADDPTPVLGTLRLFMRGGGRDPHVRQRAATKAREAATQQIVARLRGLRREWFKSLLTRAQTRAPQREDGLATLGLGYPLVRGMLLEIGRRLTDAGAVAAPDDVFWLTEAQLAAAAAALDGEAPIDSMAADVTARKALWAARREVVPPMALPLLPKFLRRLFPALGSVDRESDGDTGNVTLRGTACSVGTVTGTVRVLRGPEDFGQLAPGEILVAAITTPAWTPLFAMAGAIITDIGGPLSHGSIVAREYGIPAVLGTGDATRRLKSGDRVRVDGAKGTIQVL